mgnify:CR=1 FL=1
MKELFFYLRCLFYIKRDLKKIDNRVIPNNQNEIRAFMIVRNEALRMPYVLQHYRKLGVNRFLIIDNDSTDTTREFLLKQPDVHVFYTRKGYSNHWNWMGALLEKYGRNYWCLVVDADEIFIYPHYEELSLPKLCEYMEKNKQTAILNILVDMYPKGSIQSSNYQAGEDLIRKSPYFDPYSYDIYIDRGRNRKTGKRFERQLFRGGTRKRVFNQHANSSKVSLIKFDRKTYLTRGMHSADGVSFSDLQGVVLHFKFLFDFVARTKEEVKRGEYYKNAIAYKKYVEKIDNGSFNEIYYDGSIKYENSAQLIKLGFMKSSPDYENFINSFKNS